MATCDQLQPRIGESGLEVREFLPPREIIFGRSKYMLALQAKIEKVAVANIPVLIEGESGSGKGVMAHFIHRNSPWQDGPFVKVCCPAIPELLIESELFGYEPGSFTGARNAKPGRVESAHNGTLFLDEVAELDPALQAKLLELLQDGRFSRLGDQGSRRVDVRVICSTNRQMEREIETGGFRRDLFYRISGLVIELPPLRRRREDIPVLVEYFRDVYSAQFHRKTRPLTRATMQMLEEYNWPGNVRELQNLVKRFVVLDSDEEVIVGGISAPNWKTLHADDCGDGRVPLKELTRSVVRDLETKVIRRVLEEHNWNRKETARLLRISYRSLLYKMTREGLTRRKAVAERSPALVKHETGGTEASD